MSFLPGFCVEQNRRAYSPILPFILIGSFCPLIYLIPDTISIKGYALIGLAVLGAGMGISFLFEALGGTAESPALLPPISLPRHRQADVEGAIPENQPEEAVVFGYTYDYLDWLAEEQPTAA